MLDAQVGLSSYLGFLFYEYLLIEGIKTFIYYHG